MSGTLTTPAPGRTGGERLPIPTRRRQPAIAILGVVLMLTGAAASGALVLNASDTVGVVAAARDISAGRVITAGDLAHAEINGSGLSAIPAGNTANLVGMTATTSIPRGTLLNASMLARDPIPGPGQVAVGIALEPGATPGAGLTAGRHVAVYRVPASDGDETRAVVLVADALVLDVDTDPGGGVDRLVTLVVDAEVGPELAAAAATDAVTIALLPPGP